MESSNAIIYYDEEEFEPRDRLDWNQLMLLLKSGYEPLFCKPRLEAERAINEGSRRTVLSIHTTFARHVQSRMHVTGRQPISFSGQGVIFDLLNKYVAAVTGSDSDSDSDPGRCWQLVEDWFEVTGFTDHERNALCESFLASLRLFIDREGASPHMAKNSLVLAQAAPRDPGNPDEAFFDATQTREAEARPQSWYAYTARDHFVESRSFSRQVWTCKFTNNPNAVRRSIQAILVMAAKTRGEGKGAVSGTVQPLPLAKIVWLHHPVEPGGVVNFESATCSFLTEPQSPRRDVSLNLLNTNGDTLLHVSLRPSENALAMNCRPLVDEWMEEKKVSPLTQLFSPPNYSVAVCDHGDQYEVLFSHKSVGFYPKDIPGPITRVNYRIGSWPNIESMLPTLSEVLNMSTYASMEDFILSSTPAHPRGHLLPSKTSSSLQEAAQSSRPISSLLRIRQDKTLEAGEENEDADIALDEAVTLTLGDGSIQTSGEITESSHDSKGASQLRYMYM